MSMEVLLGIILAIGGLALLGPVGWRNGFPEEVLRGRFDNRELTAARRAYRRTRFLRNWPVERRRQLL